MLGLTAITRLSRIVEPVFARRTFAVPLASVLVVGGVTLLSDSVVAGFRATERAVLQPLVLAVASLAGGGQPREVTRGVFPTWPYQSARDVDDRPREVPQVLVDRIDQ